MKSIKLTTITAYILTLAACGGGGVNTSSSSSTTSSASSSSSSSSNSSGGSFNSFTLQESDSATCAYNGSIDNEHTGYTGSGFINTTNSVGADIIWAVNAGKAGNYSISARYANGGDSSRSGILSVDKSGLSSLLALEITNSWSDWQTELSSISLAAGNNIIRLSATTANGIANFDSIAFEGTGLSAGDCSNVLNNVAGVYPVAGSLDNNPDTYLRIHFDSIPKINSGYVNIYDAANNQQIDQINVQADQESAKVGSRIRRDGADLVTSLAFVEGNTVIIQPHPEKLSYNKTYYIVINSGVFSGLINGQTYLGASEQEWQFTTKSSAPSGTTVTVDDDGIADFSSVQGAFNYIMNNHGGSVNAQVNIKNGVYLGLLELKGKSNLRVVGENRNNTIIRARNGNNLNPGDNTRSLLVINGGDLNTFENLTIHNTIPRNVGGQAEALYYNSSGRLIIKNVAFFSEQDTVLVKGSGYSWFYNSLIAGNVDFIWGSPKTALFENSEIRSLGDSANPSSDQGGYVLQSRTANNDLGFVFLNSRFTRGSGPAGNTPGNGKSTLGRGANKTDTYDNVAFINCQMGTHINNKGFDPGRILNPSSGSALKGYREYGSQTLSGDLIDLSNRWNSYLLSSNEVNQYYQDRETIFTTGGTNWNPLP